MCQCQTAGACSCPVPCPACSRKPRLLCELCDLWIPIREDSSASPDDLGVCPRLKWPHNKTRAHDGCEYGVWPKDAGGQ